MGAIINYKEFVEPIYIDTAKEETRNILNDNYCPFVEEMVLRKLFGETLYNDFILDKTVTKYANLINGVTAYYTYNSVTRKFTGIKKMLAYFTYFEFIPDQYSYNSQFGQKKPKANNSESVIDHKKLIRAWNKGVDLYNEAIFYMQYINSIIPDTYEDLLSEEIEHINQWGI
jgi:hypothetical protein